MTSNINMLVTLLRQIEVATGSDLGPQTAYSDIRFRDLPQHTQIPTGYITTSQSAFATPILIHYLHITLSPDDTWHGVASWTALARRTL
jgi:hypothetical protein